ncbi:MAG: methyltransferase domain-containing protein [Nanoarchaeota archaeon]|nr:methyltransferase domain-containing protein [Nanoarchaeota archaeon]
MKYVFILGRNLDLSVLEVTSYLEKKGINLLKSELIDNGFFVETKEDLGEKIISSFGGVIAFGKVLCKINEKELEEQIIYGGVKRNIRFVVWNFDKNNSYNKLSLYLKNRFRVEGLKASEKGLTGSLELQNGKKIRISAGLVDEEYFVFNDYFGRITEKTDFKEIEERDMKKPERRESLAISPRLAKILINISQVKEEETLLDSFCGVGVILQEALLQKIKVIGIDKDDAAISGAKKNLSWLGFNDYEIINSDSSSVKIRRVNALVTEPDLGALHRKMPTNEEIIKIINNYERLMIRVLNNLKKSVEGRIVFTAPFIKSFKKRIGCNIQNVLDKTKLILINGPIQEYRYNQIVGREIFVLKN